MSLQAWEAECYDVQVSDAGVSDAKTAGCRNSAFCVCSHSEEACGVTYGYWAVVDVTGRAGAACMRICHPAWAYGAWWASDANGTKDQLVGRAV